jgi:hypothetical protein
MAFIILTPCRETTAKLRETLLVFCRLRRVLARFRGNRQNLAIPHKSKGESFFRAVLSVSRQAGKMAAANFTSRDAENDFRPDNLNLNQIQNYE